MNLTNFLLRLSLWLLIAGCAQAQDAHSAAARETGWTQLFNGKNLDGWYTKIQNHPKNDDPGKVFQLEDGVIHVYKDQPEGTAVPSGYLATEAEYENYHVRLEYKCGEKKFKPRMTQRRDAGLLYHIVGTDTVWPRCIECQIQENDVGDCFTVRGAQVDVLGELADAEKKIYRYKPKSEGGTTQTVGDGGIRRVIKATTNEHDGWNSVEIVVHGDAGSQHIVNGATVFESTALRQLGPPEDAGKPHEKGQDPPAWQPLRRGKIALQAEFSEVFYRNVEIQILDSATKEHRNE